MLNAFNNLDTKDNDIKIEEIDDDEPRPSIPREPNRDSLASRDTFKSVDPESEITNLEVFKGSIKKNVDQ